MESIEGEEQKIIKKFCAGIFMDREKLEENNINYPIKLEYYKIKNLENDFGVEVVKTEYREGFTKVENETILKITKEENVINDVIYRLKRNTVTPIGLTDTVAEMLN